MSIRIDGTNTTANPGITGGDADTGLQFGTDEVSIVTGGTERVKFESTQISTQSIDFTINSGNVNFTSGFGIDFTDTANGSGTVTTELFSDYEEGTWSGTLGQGGTGFNMVNQKYIKCGRLCWVTGRINGLTGPTAGGIQIDNLPYASYVSPTWEATGTCMMDSVNYTTVPVQVTPYISNATQIYFYMTFDNASWSQLTGNEMTTSGSIIFSLIYPTAS